MPDHYLLQWSNYLTNIAAAFSTLRHNNKLVDVTLAADGRSVQAHKVVLCACSAYFEELLSANPCKHPIVFLKDVQYEHLSAVVEFMYNGAVYVGNEQLDEVLSLGASLRVRGMVDVKGASSRQGSNDEGKDPETPAGKKRKRRPALSRENSTDDPGVPASAAGAPLPAAAREQEPAVSAPAAPAVTAAAASSSAAAAAAAAAAASAAASAVPPASAAPQSQQEAAAASAEPAGKPATVPTAAERKAAPPRSYSEGDMTTKAKEGLDGEDGSSPRAKRCLLQRQPRVKRECDQPVSRESTDDQRAGARSPTQAAPAASVETIISDAPPSGPYLAVPGSYWPVRQMSTPTPVLSTREGTLVKQGSMPTLATAPPAGPATVQKQRSTPVLSRGASGPAFFMVSSSSSTPLMPMMVSQSQAVPQILLTSADEPAPAERTLGCRSHAPVLRDGPAVSCSHCWNTEYSQGRTLRRKTKYMCRDCSVSLCIVPCFQEYHESVSKAPLVVSRDPSKTGAKKILPKLGSL